MRWLLILCILAAAACSKVAPEQGLSSGIYKSGALDALCVAKAEGGERGGLIVYGEGETNCSLSGRIEASGGGYVLVPAGEGGCRIGLAETGGSISIGSVPGACSYYCAPGASLSGKRFKRVAAQGRKVVDLAGDPLC